MMIYKVDWRNLPHRSCVSPSPLSFLLIHKLNTFLSSSILYLQCIQTMTVHNPDDRAPIRGLPLPRLPPLLFHIRHADSQANYPDITKCEYNITAAEPIPAESTWADINALAKRHQNWYNKRPSCFISTFRDEKHARNWGKQRKGPVYMYVVDTTRLEHGQCVLRMAKGPVPDTEEYLFFDQIPGDAIREREMIKGPADLSPKGEDTNVTTSSTTSSPSTPSPATPSPSTPSPK